ncbi:MAG: zinc ribbon domain-containing protein [Oscillospiraceae bacterium]|nr:zinc ribbon domain-containing protein [Oscillospiraceae bacterium]
MAKRTCPACGAPVSPGEEFCSYCGALVPHNEAAAAQTAQAVQSAPEPEREKRRVQTPRTIEELQAFCERHELPLAKMRFFIGLDYPGAKAYGIFKDKNGDFVVYKNKADGSRAVRYRGPDEAFAVGELFQKLKDEASGQRARVAAARTPGYPASSAHDNNPYNFVDGSQAARRAGRRKSNKLLIGIIALAAAITIGRTAAAVHHNAPLQPSTGYYHYNDQYYYNQNDSWYLYDDYGGWYPIYTVDDELTQNYGDYYTSYSYDDGYGVESFSDSSYYDEDSSSYSSDWDSDSSSSWSWDWDDDDTWDSSDDWDWDSDWDSDFGDWDSDW